MKKIVILILCMLFLQAFAVTAMTASEAKDAWQDSKEASQQAREIHRNAKIDHAANRNQENLEKVIGSGKDSMNAALDEAEAWLVWKDIEADENDEIPEELRAQIKADIEANRAKIDDLREEVDSVETQFEMGVVFLKMVGKYRELLTDVARNSGKIWVHIANERVEDIEDFEARLRESAETMDDNEDMISELDAALDDIEDAKESIEQAEDAYEEVVQPGTPLIKFSEGNNYLRIARGNLLAAHVRLNNAFRLMNQRGDSE